jgi:hypothetical protein
VRRVGAQDHTYIRRSCRRVGSDSGRPDRQRRHNDEETINHSRRRVGSDSGRPARLRGYNAERSTPNGDLTNARHIARGGARVGCALLRKRAPQTAETPARPPKCAKSEGAGRRAEATSEARKPLPDEPALSRASRRERRRGEEAKRGAQDCAVRARGWRVGAQDHIAHLQARGGAET